MDEKFIKWLYRELLELTAKGILTEESANRLHNYYGEAKQSYSKSTTVLVFGILGAFFIGAGIILLFAHNWNYFSRVEKTVISFIPLVVSQIMAVWVVLKDKKSLVWREGISIFYTISIGATISLISQVYHISGEFYEFLLTWMILSLPIAYLFDTSSPIIVYLVGITSWACYEQIYSTNAVLFWPLALLILPFYLKEFKNNKYGNRTVLFSWIICLCLSVALEVTLEKVLPGIWIITYSSFFGVLYIVGSRWFADAETKWQKPFYSIGLIGILGMSYLLTYKWSWHEIGFNHYRHSYRYNEAASIVDYIVTALLFLSNLFLAVDFIRKGEKEKITFSLFCIISLIGFFAAGYFPSGIFSSALFNFYFLILGIIILVKGIKNERLGVINVGMLIIMFLVVSRFFDSEFSFVTRGLVFVILGICFLITNLIIINRRGVKK